jgi:predicted dienelactone hydrolase
MKSQVLVLMITLVIGLTLSACSPQQLQPPPTTTYTIEPAYLPTVSPTVKPSNTSQATTTMPPATATIPLVTQEPVSFPLSERGPYFVGKLEHTIVDESRSDRKIQLDIWYPALEQTDDDGRTITINAEPDLSGAPYPLILTEEDSGYYIFRSHLASHGFVMAEIEFPYYFDKWDFQTTDLPLDFLFALDQIASNPPIELEGVIDATHTGVTGYSFGGQNALALSGARIDPVYYLEYCEQMPTMQPPIEDWYVQLACDLAKKWDAFTTYVGDEITTSDDGLWQPMTDERIRAVMPGGVDGAWLFGERGLETVDRPVLFIQAAEDSPYQPTEAAFIFEHIGIPERSMISFVGENHLMVMKQKITSRINHFAVAFFGYYLQGREEYADYFSDAFVSQFDDLYWGVYQDE